MSSGASMYEIVKYKDFGDILARNVVISQVLAPTNTKYQNRIINNNLVNTYNIDHDWLAKNQWTKGVNAGVGYCPNFYRGSNDYCEKFISKQKIEIKQGNSGDTAWFPSLKTAHYPTLSSYLSSCPGQNPFKKERNPSKGLKKG